MVNNTVVLIGRLTKDAELSTVERKDGSNTMDKLTFTVAVDRQGQESGADFVRCTILNGQRTSSRTYAATMHQYLVKGKLVAIGGQLRIDSVKTALPNGEFVYKTYAGVMVQSVQLLSPKAKDEAAVPDEESEGELAGVGAGLGDGDIPF